LRHTFVVVALIVFLSIANVALSTTPQLCIGLDCQNKLATDLPATLQADVATTVNLSIGSVSTATSIRVQTHFGGVFIDPKIVVFNQNGVGNTNTVELTCNSPGDIITVEYYIQTFFDQPPYYYYIYYFDTFNSNYIGSQSAFCRGGISLDAPSSANIGETFTVTVDLNPPASSPEDVTITVSNSLVAPATRRLTFASGQSSKAVSFRTTNTSVGLVDITFTSRNLRSYGSVSITGFTVFGYISSNATANSVGKGVKTTIAVIPNPPPPVDTNFTIDASSIGIFNPTELTIGAGEAFGVFTVTPNGEGSDFTVTSPFYNELNDSLDVIGVLLLTIPETIGLTSVSATLAVDPTPSGSLTVSISTSSNIQTVSSVVLSSPYDYFNVTGLSAGIATITLSAPGYVTTTFQFVVSNPPLCLPTQILSTDLLSCMNCPVEMGVSCSGNGECVNSGMQTACICYSSFFNGPACQFTEQPTTIPTSGGLVGIPLSGPGSLVVQVPQLANGANDVDVIGFEIDPLNPTPGTVSPVDTKPVLLPAGTQVSVYPLGFYLEASSPVNNAGLVDPTLPFTITLTFSPSTITVTKFLQAQLYLWNGQEWVDVQSTCPSSSVKNINTLTATWTTCALGQFQVFIVVPAVVSPPTTPSEIDQQIVRTNATEQLPNLTTGVTGVQPPLPPQPSIDVNRFDPSNQVPSDSTFVVPSTLALMLSMIVALIGLVF